MTRRCLILTRAALLLPPSARAYDPPTVDPLLARIDKALFLHDRQPKLASPASYKIVKGD